MENNFTCSEIRHHQAREQVWASEGFSRSLTFVSYLQASLSILVLYPQPTLHSMLNPAAHDRVWAFFRSFMASTVLRMGVQTRPPSSQDTVLRHDRGHCTGSAPRLPRSGHSVPGTEMSGMPYEALCQYSIAVLPFQVLPLETSIYILSPMFSLVPSNLTSIPS